MQRIMLALTIGVAIALRIAGAQAAMTITPEVQAMIDRHVTQIQEWIADPVIVKAVAAQNPWARSGGPRHTPRRHRPAGRPGHGGTVEST